MLALPVEDQLVPGRYLIDRDDVERILSEVEQHPGEPHHFETICRRCGANGILHVSLITRGEKVTITEVKGDG